MNPDIILVETTDVQVIEVAPGQVELQDTIIAEVIEVGIVGPQGPSGGAGSTYVHDQAVPNSVWVIVHNLGYFPNVTVEDSGGNEHEPSIVYDSGNQLTLTFSGSFGGKAYLS